jgi:hypothetical protein
MKLYFSIIAALVAGTAHAETWVYHDTLPTQVAVYVDMASVKTIMAAPEIRSAVISLGRPGEDATMKTIEVACKYSGIRTNPELNFSTTQKDMIMGRLVKAVCTK